MKSRMANCGVQSPASPSSAAKRRVKTLQRILSGLLLLGLSGCAAKRLKADFSGFELGYAETSNREVLLNLARLQNREPTYFFKIGQITSSYKMSAGINGTGTYTTASANPTIGSPAGGGSTSVGYENDPVFQFVPVNDQANAESLLKPIPPETFYLLYQQGWRVDQLFRLLVDRIEITWNTKAGCRVESIRNLPPAVFSSKNGTLQPDYSRDSALLSNYVAFLRTSGVAYELQKDGFLLLRGSNQFSPYDEKSGVTNPPTATDLINASAKSAVWEKQSDNLWYLGEKVFQPAFYLNPPITSQRAQESANSNPAASDSSRWDMAVNADDIAIIKQRILSDQGMSELQNGATLTNVLSILAKGFSIASEADPNATDAVACKQPATGFTVVSSHLVMRSLLGAMAAAAQEQLPFEALLKDHPPIPPSTDMPVELQDSTRPDFLQAVPQIEQIPLLQLKAEPEDTSKKAYISVNYRSRTYMVPETSSTEVPENQYWDRDMFRLISQLQSQVTVDISKFPLTQILQ